MLWLGQNSQRAGVTLAFRPAPLCFKYHHRAKLVCRDRAQVYLDAEPERSPEIQRTPQQHSGLGRLGGVEPVQRAMITPADGLRRVVAEPRIAELIPAQ